LSRAVNTPYFFVTDSNLNASFISTAPGSGLNK
jgi:hypothetical protein